MRKTVKYFINDFILIQCLSVIKFIFEWNWDLFISILFKLVSFSIWIRQNYFYLALRLPASNVGSTVLSNCQQFHIVALPESLLSFPCGGCTKHSPSKLSFLTKLSSAVAILYPPQLHTACISLEPHLCRLLATSCPCASQIFCQFHFSAMFFHPQGCSLEALHFSSLVASLHLLCGVCSNQLAEERLP